MPPGRDIPAARYRAAVGVDETMLQADGPGCLPSAPAGGGGGGQNKAWTIEFLRGDWSVERQIRDWRAGQDGSFRGTARFRESADGCGLDYTEDGELRFGSHHGPAQRRLIYRGRADGAADVRFADGREFYRLDLRSGSWQAEHSCRADSYHVTTTRLSPDSFTETWQVAGPGKDYELMTTYRRIITGGLSGLGPACSGATVARLAGGPR
jgi:Family of unknown function (DUF6314)